MPSAAIPQLVLEPKKARKKGRRKSPGLICCCRFVRRDKVPSPIYTARELSVTSLAIQQQQNLTSLGPSQQRPLTKANGKGHFKKVQTLAIPLEGAFADDTPSNRMDYLDCGLQGKGEEEEGEGTLVLETARTSPQEDLAEYRPMEQLVDEIFSESSEGTATLGSRKAEAGERQEQRKQQLQLQSSPAMSGRDKPGGEEQSMGAAHGGARLAEPSQSPSPDSPALPSPSTAPFCAASSAPADLECQLPLALLNRPPPAWRLALSGLPQSVLQLCWLAYVWMASSLAFLLDWLH